MNDKYLIFLESYTKQKTIKNFLGKDYEIFATGGHLAELAKKGDYNLGLIDWKKFIPQYDLLETKKSNLIFWQNYLKRNQVKKIYLATDPDREGEGIAKQVVDYLRLKPQQYQRLLFYEITPNSVKEALANPLDINHHLVEAQMSRQVLDRMIGFCLSPLLQKKLKALSAGRVQSVVLKLIVDRELAIKEYEKTKEFILQGIVEIREEKFSLRQKDEKGRLVIYPNQKEAEGVKDQLGSTFKLLKKEKEQRYIFAKEPFTTSLLLYEAKLQLGFSIAKTTSLAQQLYEGIWLKAKNQQISLITYPRTDSRRLNKNFISQVHQYIKNQWGKEYCQFSPQHQGDDKKTLNVQDAHEAIRPTYFVYHPDVIKEALNEEQWALYNLIFTHSLSSLMSPAQAEKSVYTFSNNSYYFEMQESVLNFAGFFACNASYYLSNYKIKKNSLLSKEDLNSLTGIKVEIKEYLENKPRRYNEGNLVQELERLGIGRPSTYNTFSRLLLLRNYVIYNNEKQKHFIPTELGLKVNEWLQKNFPALINEKYTANLEGELDKISRGENTYLDFIQNFWKNFFPEVRKIESI